MFNKYFYNLSVTILGIVVSVFILTTVGGLFHIPVNPFFVFIPFIGGLYYLKNQSPENIDFLKQFLILLLIILFSCVISIHVWDSSFDGRWYHSANLVMLKNGWLPVYQNYEDFALKCHVYPASAFWGNCYLRFTEIIGANIYKLTNLIESAKAVNFIILSAVFMYSFSVLGEFTKSKFIRLISSLIIILNPVCICQWFTNYIDLHIYFAFTLLVLTIIKIERRQSTDKTDLFMFVSSGLMLSMTKFTGCMYLFIVCFTYFIYLLLLKRNIKKYIKTILVTGSLISITAISPFYTNFRDWGHPFYPVFGKNAKDVIKENLPYGFENMSKTEKFLRSTFSESVNSMNVDTVKALQKPVKLKIPFTIQIKSFLYTFCFPDIRAGGFGYFWSGILLLSLFYLPFIRFRNKNERNMFWLIQTMIISSTILNPHCWWARLVPQFWLFPVFIPFFGLLQQYYKNNLYKNLKLSALYFIIFALIINNLIILSQNAQFSPKVTNAIKMPYKHIASVKSSDNKILLMIRPDKEKNLLADETVIPHLEEYFGKDNIIYIPYDENKIISREYLPVRHIFVIHNSCYFFKINK